MRRGDFVGRQRLWLLAMTTRKMHHHFRETHSLNVRAAAVMSGDRHKFLKRQPQKRLFSCRDVVAEVVHAEVALGQMPRTRVAHRAHMAVLNIWVVSCTRLMQPLERLAPHFCAWWQEENELLGWLQIATFIACRRLCQWHVFVYRHMFSYQMKIEKFLLSDDSKPFVHFIVCNRFACFIWRVLKIGFALWIFWSAEILNVNWYNHRNAALRCAIR